MIINRSWHRPLFFFIERDGYSVLKLSNSNFLNLFEPLPLLSENIITSIPSFLFFNKDKV